jgi:perosamine synthetase
MRKDFDIRDEIRSWSVYIPEEAIDALKDVMQSRWINTGDKEMEFRRVVSEKFHLPHCVACNSGTSALRASLAAIGVKRGDEVVSTPYTFIATNTSILEQGANPVFADIDYKTLNISPNSIANKITSKTKAIMCVHYGGNPCDMDSIREIADMYNLPVIEDSAHAMGSKYKGDYIGSKGDICTFSLQSVKIITTGDGGFISTTHPSIYEKLRKLVFFGVDRDHKHLDLIDPLPPDIDILGFKYNMNDIIATLGIVGINNFDTPFDRRKVVGERYRKELDGLRKIRLLHYPKENTPNYQIFPIHVSNREEFASFMHSNNIIVNVNNRRNDRYSVFGGIQDLPNLSMADNDTILIPIHADLTDEDVDRIIEKIHEYDRT